MRQKVTKNIGKDGMNLDIHVSGQPNTSTRKVKNFRVVTRDNNSFILTSVKGNEAVGSITQYYIPVAIADRNGVAYIVSAEVIEGQATGRGEVGTFPSPDYQGSEGSLEYVYRPLKNYGGDNDEFPLLDGNFNSAFFNFDLVNILDITLQNDYDRSINIIITDGKNPIRIINSGFTVLPGGKYSISDRGTGRETNRYSAENFTNTLNLILRSKNLIKVEFNGLESGGSVGFGNWQYFFSYSTLDGNETEVQAQTLMIPVYNGQSFLNISGGRNSGEKSNKQVRVTLQNVDTSFSYISVYAIHTDGMNSRVQTGYKIDKRFRITSSTVEIFHTGFETLINTPVNLIQDELISIDTAKCLEQSDGHLMIANIKEKQYDEGGFEEFIRNIKIGHKKNTLDIIGPELNHAADSNAQVNYNRFNEVIDSSLKPGTDGYIGGYLNAKNVHDRLGYWGGETYPFAARLIHKDGFSSRLFPCSGVDNLKNDSLATLEGKTESDLETVRNAGGFDLGVDSNKMINTKGLYRFPERNQIVSTSPSGTISVRNVYRILRQTWVNVFADQYSLSSTTTVLFGGVHEYVTVRFESNWFSGRNGFIDVVNYNPNTYSPGLVLSMIQPHVNVPMADYADQTPIPGQSFYYRYILSSVQTGAQVAGPDVVTVTTGEELLRFTNVGPYKEARITIHGVTFKIPNIPQEILDKTIGIQFFRGERNRDAIAQGTFIDAEVVPAVRYDQANDTNRRLNAFPYTPTSFRLIPSFDHEYDSIHRWDDDGSNNGRTNNENDSDNILGLVPTKLKMGGGRSITQVMPGKTPFSFLSTDLIVNPMLFTGLLSKDIYVKMIYEITHRRRVATRFVSTSGINNLTHYSAIVPSIYSPANVAQESTAKASWVPENLEDFNDLKFSTMAYFQGKYNDNHKWTLYRMKFNQYLGIIVDNGITIPSLGIFGSGGNGPDVQIIDQLNQASKSSYLGNIYSGNGIRSQSAIKSIYDELGNVRYFPISDKIYWNSSVEGADPSNTLEERLDADRKITLYGGDCFVNCAFRKLYINAEIGDDTYSQLNRVMVGPHIVLVNESNINAAFRSPETVDVTEGERQHPSQYLPLVPSLGDRYGEGNQYRSTKKLEANIGNKGYGETAGGIGYALLDNDSLFLENNWFARVWHSPKHIPNSYENAYRRFLPGDYQDYDPKNGEIIKLVNNNGKLYCIQERGIGVIPINERIQTGNDSAGAIFVESSGVLGPFMGRLTDEFGSRYKDSVIGTDNAVYGVDLERFTIWKTEDGGINTISLFSIASLLEQSYKGLTNEKISLMNHDIVSVWDKKYDEVIFTFYHKLYGSYTSERNFTVIYNEITKKFHSFLGVLANRYFRVNDDLYSFNVVSQTNLFWLHDSENVPYYSFYGQNQDARIAFVINPDSDINKVFDSIEIISNRTAPASINYYVQGASATQELFDVPGDIITSNMRYKNESWRIPISKVKQIHNQDVERQESIERAGAESLLGLKSRLKGKYLIIELVYTNQKLVEFQSLLTTFQLMK
jgi:hypothetical protein